ncbi:myelin-associated glycoprotein-like isoform X2 [Danio rerio]|uniref:Myelin-associated glycoprotein-like isoform X2 n=2 Tax=Danio rerio TaxID=7955 RepID=A0AC58IRD7_DANRE
MLIFLVFCVFCRVPAMSVFKTTFIIIISSFVFLHTHSADVQYSAVMPHTVTALTGSCVQIPCTFNTSNFEDKLKETDKYFHGVWLKNKSQFVNTDSFIAFNSSKNIIRGFSDIQMTGDLSKRNCTTVFYNMMMNHSDKYYFRLEAEPDVFKGTFINEPVRISVRDLAKQPELEPKNLSNVMEERTVNLSCSAEAPCPKQPPTISWSYIPRSANITTQLLENPDKTQSVFSLMTFKASYNDHRKNISCIVTYPRNESKNLTVMTNVMLLVQFPPKETHIIISPSASFSAGTNVTLTCSSKASPSNVNYTWYKHEEKRPVAIGEHITFIVTSIITGRYYCTAQNKHGSQLSEEIQLTVKGQNELTISVTAACVGGTVAVLMLSAVGFYTKITKKTNSEENAGEKDYLNQAQDRTIDSTYADVFTMTNQDNKISDVQSFCKNKHNTEGNSAEDINENASDVVYAQVHVLLKKTKSFNVQREDIYAQVKK